MPQTITGRSPGAPASVRWRSSTTGKPVSRALTMPSSPRDPAITSPARSINHSLNELVPQSTAAANGLTP